MENFLLLVRGENKNASPEQMQQILMRYQTWMQKWKDVGKYVDGSPLRQDGVQLAPGGVQQNAIESESSDELISGFIWIKATSVDEAVEISRECPLLDNLEIRVRPFLTI